MKIPNRAILLLGGNTGNIARTLYLTVQEVEKIVGKVIGKSSVYESEPWGMALANTFLNQAVEIKTDCTPSELLSKVLQIEASFGRVRTNSQPESRPIDIDIMFYNQIVINRKDIVIPHPRLHLRRFALIPLSELAPGYIHPIFGKTINELLIECNDPLYVRKYSEPKSQLT